MKVLHLLSAGNIGGIEVLCKDIAQNDKENNIFAFLFDGGAIEDKIREIGAPVYSVYKEKRWNIWKRMRILDTICEENQIKAVLVHNDGISILIYYLLLAKRKQNIYFIRYFHSVFEEKYYYDGNMITNRLKKHLIRQSLKRSDRIVAVSECVKQSFLDNFEVDRRKMHVIYNGISEALFENNPQKSNFDKKNKIEIIYVGRLVDVKGIDILLEAFGRLLEKKPEIILRLIGDGEERKSYQEQVRSMGIEQSVIFEGFQMEKERYFREADIFVYPSRCEEAFGISIVEAMAYGLLCIASNAGGIPEIIKDGQNGFLFKNEDSMDLEKKLLLAISSIEERQEQEMSLQAKETAHFFTIENTIEQLHELYHSLGDEQG